MMNNKTQLLISATPDTFSGYGARSRDLISSIIRLKSTEWDIKILSRPWGSCPFGALDENDPQHQEILKRIVQPQDIKEQPDLYRSVTVPNEMVPIGKYNILVTAGIESTAASKDVIEGCNRSDLIIVSSQHAKNVLLSSSWDHLNHVQQKIGTIKVEKPVEILFEGCDLSIFNNKFPGIFDLPQVKEQFCFLIVGHVLAGFEQYSDRKNIALTIKTFLQTFKNLSNPPALVLKSSMAGFSLVEENQILQFIDNIRKTVKASKLPPIYLIHGELTDVEMAGLYRNPKIKALIAPGTEGYGRPALEFSCASSLPILSAPFGGQIDFLEKEFNVFVGGSIQPVHPSVVGPYFIKESGLFVPDVTQLSALMKDMFENYKNYVDGGKRQGHRSRTMFSIEKMDEKLDEILKAKVPTFSKPVSITLPKLSRPVQLPKMQ